MHAEILARTAEGWEWLDERVPVDEAYEEAGGAVEAGLAALEAEVDEGRLDAGEVRELVADARFELASNEHHLGGRDSEAIEALRGFEDEMSEQA